MAGERAAVSIMVKNTVALRERGKRHRPKQNDCRRALKHGANLEREPRNVERAKNSSLHFGHVQLEAWS
jgi:hypothetical protein